MSDDYWKTRTFTLAYLFDRAECVAWLGETIPAMNWLQAIGVVPYNVNWSKLNSNPRTALDPMAIEAGYLAELAFEWDADGVTSPHHFVSALEFEVAGTKPKMYVAEVMSGLGRGR